MAYRCRYVCFLVFDFQAYVRLLRFSKLDALTIPRSRLLEINYVLRVTANTGSLSSDVFVELPVTVINFFSLFPPPVPSSTHLAAASKSSESNSRLFTENNEAKTRNRATSIPARKPLSSDPNSPSKLPKARPTRPQMASHRISLPDTGSFARAHKSDSSSPSRRDSTAKGHPSSHQYYSQNDNSDGDDIDELIKSARLGETDDDTHTDESASINHSEANPLSNTAYLDYSSSQQDQNTVRSRQLPNPPKLPLASASFQLVPAPAAPRSRSQSRSKIPSTFLRFPQPTHQHSEPQAKKFDENGDDDKTPKIPLPESADFVQGILGDRHSDFLHHSMVHDESDIPDRDFNAVWTSESKAEGSSSVFNDGEGQRDVSIPKAKALPPLKLKSLPSLSLNDQSSITLPLRLSRPSHTSTKTEKGGTQEPTSPPNISASTSVKARIAQLERAGLNKAG